MNQQNPYPSPSQNLKIKVWPYYLALTIMVIILWVLWSPRDSFWKKSYNRQNENQFFERDFERINDLEESFPDSSMNIAEKIIREADERGDNYSKARAYYSLASTQLLINSETEKLVSALSYSKTAKILFSKSLNPFWQAQNNCQISSIFLYMAKQGESYTDSISYYLKQAEGWVPLIEDSRTDSLSSLANILKIKASVINKLDLLDDESNKDSLELSIGYSRQAYDIYLHELNDEVGQAICLRNQARYFSLLNVPDSSFSYLERVLALGEKLDSDLIQSSALNIMGDCYYDIFVEDSAYASFINSIRKYKEALRYPDLDKANTYLDIAQSFHQAAFFAYFKIVPYKSEYATLLDSAASYYTFAYKAALEENQLSVLKEVGFQYAKICAELTGESKCQKMLEDFQEVFEVPGFRNNAQLFASQQLEGFERRIQQKNASNQRKFILLAGSFILLLMTLAFLFNYERIRVGYMKNQLYARLKTLQAQMNPHFISNSLNSIESLINLEENRKASKYLIEFSRLARMILGFTTKDEISILDEMKMLKTYLSLERLRMNKKLDYVIKVDEKIDPEEIFIPPMMLQPFVENSIWHGIKPKEKGGKINISFIEKSENIISCIIEDDGVGREKSLELKSQSSFQHVSYSTKLIEERIAKLKLLKGGDIKITDLKDEKGQVRGTRVEVLVRLLDR